MGLLAFWWALLLLPLWAAFRTDDANERNWFLGISVVYLLFLLWSTRLIVGIERYEKKLH